MVGLADKTLMLLRLNGKLVRVGLADKTLMLLRLNGKTRPYRSHDESNGLNITSDSCSAQVFHCR